MLACPECERPFDAGRCSCRRDWTETGGVPDLYVPGVEQGEDPALSSRIRAWFEERPGDPWRPDDDADALRAWGAADPLLGAIDAELPARARVVDLGCGSGRAAALLALAGREVLGVDLAMTGLLRAEAFRRRAELASLSFVRASLFRPPVSPGAADLVLMLGAVEASGNPAAAVRAAARCLAPGGLLVARIDTPWAPPLPPDARPPYGGGHLPEAVIGWLISADLKLRNADPPLAPFGRPRPLLAHGAAGGALARWVHQLRWGLGAGPAAVVYVGVKS